MFIPNVNIDVPMRTDSTGVSRRTVLRGLGGTVGTLSLAGCLRTADHATYWTESRNIDIEYDAIQTAAVDGGYDVVEPFYVNSVEAGGIAPELPALADTFGPDYRVYGLDLYYTESVFLEVWLTSDQPRVSLFDERRQVFDTFPVDSLPPEEWLQDRLSRVFDVSPSMTTGIIAALRDQVTTGTEIPHVAVEEPLTFEAFYGWLQSERTRTTGSTTGGDGWYTETSYQTDTRLASIAFIVQSMAIRQHDGQRRYELKLDRLGGFSLSIRLPPGETIPESEYRGVFRELLRTVGLPPAIVDELTFEYESSIW